MRHADNDVLRDVTFQARRGEVLVMLGPNGAGKTTTIEILEGFRSARPEAFQSWRSTLRRATSVAGPDRRRI
ncbi:ATP-binding cassette domain-containing protein, partial [Rhodococcus hoagii]|nr:ATP-binding cassette domain-containing protein [Prescottella equi]